MQIWFESMQINDRGTLTSYVMLILLKFLINLDTIRLFKLIDPLNVFIFKG